MRASVCRQCLLILLPALFWFGGCAPALYSPDGDARRALTTLLEAPSVPADIAEAAPPLDLLQLEQAVSEEVNRVRRTQGLAPLAWNTPLATAARMHSADMATRAFFGHQSPEGETTSDRARAAVADAYAQRLSVRYEGVGENVYLAHRFREYRMYEMPDGERRYEADWKAEREIARHAVATWMESPTHRANLLSPVYEAQAIGAATGEGATVFITQNLMLHRHAAR